MKAAVSLVVLIIAVAFGVYIRGRAAAMDRANEGLKAKVVQLEEALQSEASRRGNEPTGNGLQQAEKLELMRLRNEVTQLRASSQGAADAEAENARLLAENRQLRETARGNQPQPAGPSIAREQWAFQGYGTPEAAYMSGMWAMKEGQVSTLLATMTAEERQRFEAQNQGKTDAEIAARFQKEFGTVTGLRIANKHQVSPSEVVLEVDMEFPQPVKKKVRMNLVGNEWKAGGPIDQNYDPMAFYRKNPELMRRYFPHLFQAENGASAAAAQEEAVIPEHQ